MPDGAGAAFGRCCAPSGAAVSATAADQAPNSMSTGRIAGLPARGRPSARMGMSWRFAGLDCRMARRESDASERGSIETIRVAVCVGN